MKKAQTEIIGLVVIVILLIIIGLIFIGFKLRKGPDTLANIRTKINADSLLNSLMKLSLCDKEQLSNIIKQCFESNNLVCNQECKPYIQQNVENIMNLTLNPGTTYKFEILEQNNEFLSFGNCKGNIFSSSHILATKSGTVDIKLKLCK